MIDNGVSVLARVAAADEAYAKEIMPRLVRHLATCRPREAAQHAERSLVAIRPGDASAFLLVLGERMPEQTLAQQKRVRCVTRKIEQIAAMSEDQRGAG